MSHTPMIANDAKVLRSLAAELATHLDITFDNEDLHAIELEIELLAAARDIISRDGGCVPNVVDHMLERASRARLVH